MVSDELQPLEWRALLQNIRLGEKWVAVIDTSLIYSTSFNVQIHGYARFLGGYVATEMYLKAALLVWVEQ